MKKILFILLGSILAINCFGQSNIRYAPINNPILTGNPRAVTQTSTDNSISIATDAFVQANFTNNTIYFAPGTFINSGTSGSPFALGFLTNNNTLTGLSVYKDSTISTTITPLLALDNRWISSATTDIFSPALRLRANRFSVTDQTSDFLIYHEVNDNTPVDQLVVSYSLGGVAPTKLFSIDRFSNFNILSGGNLALNVVGTHIVLTEGTNGYKGQTTLVSGTKAITINGLTTSSRAFLQFVSIGGTVTTTWQYAGVCTSNTLTITALTTTGTTNTSDTSVINYIIY